LCEKFKELFFILRYCLKCYNIFIKSDKKIFTIHLSAFSNHRCSKFTEFVIDSPIRAAPSLVTPTLLEKHVSFSQPFGKEHVSRKENWSVNIAKVDEKIA